MNVNEMKDRIEQMPKNYHVEMARILINTHKISYDENQNGLFFNLSQLSVDVYEKMQHFIEYVELQERQLKVDEIEKDELKDSFFK